MDVRTGQWMHLAFVVDILENETTVYVNEKKVASHSHPFPYIAPQDPIELQGSLPETCDIALFRLWGRPLSHKEFSLPNLSPVTAYDRKSSSLISLSHQKDI